MIVVKVVDQDISDKIDTQYISDQFPDVTDTGVVFICTAEGGEDDEWVDESGVRHIVIQLPYDLITQLDDARPFMLEKVRERLL